MAPSNVFEGNNEWSRSPLKQEEDNVFLPVNASIGKRLVSPLYKLIIVYILWNTM